MKKNKLTVLNSKFINLFANATAGAIGCKGTDLVIIQGCSFINVTSSKNAGAVYADINAVNLSYNSIVTIANSLFEKCSSNFGGAYIQLGGKLNLVNCDFVNNAARYYGGALCLSNTTALIGNNRFNRNSAEYNGGAAYIDDTSTIINSCDFINNTATNFGSGIYLYDSKYEIKNSFFTKSDNEVIVSFFDRKGSVLKNNELNGGKTLLNQIVTMKLNKVTYNVKTNSNGYAILNIPNSVKPGTYTLTATYLGQTIENTVKVTQVLKLSKVKVRKSAKKLVISATLKKGKTPIKNKKLTFKFNGKKYTAKTNKKGIAKITVKKSVLKKLKVGKKVKYQVTYIKDTVTRTVKVKR